MCQSSPGAECSRVFLQTNPPSIRGRLTPYLPLIRAPFDPAGKSKPPSSPAPEREGLGLRVLFGLAVLYSGSLISLTVWE